MSRRAPATQSQSLAVCRLDGLLSACAPIGSVRRCTTPPPPPALAASPGLARQVLHTVSIQRQWGLLDAFLLLIASLTGAFGAVTGWI